MNGLRRRQTGERAMALQHIHPLTREVTPNSSEAPAGKLLAGSGAQRVWNAFSDAGGRFHTGFWQHGPGTLAVSYTEAELCVILEGRVRLTGPDGAAEFGPGEAFTIAPGFSGSWESIGTVTKIYAILEI